MKINSLLQILDRLIPRDFCYSKDPTGLLVGSNDSEITGIMIALDVTEDVIVEAMTHKCSLIISHHPLFYYPLYNLAAGSFYNDIVRKLVKNDIDLISLHTRFDLLLKNGVSKSLAKALHLKDIQPLAAIEQSKEIETRQTVKLVIYTPVNFVEQIKTAIHLAGGAVIGNYDNCFFVSNGTGSFRGNSDSNPFIGTKLEISSVDEVKLETIVLTSKIQKVLAAVKNSHPYEEPAVDIFPVQTMQDKHSLGCVGYLPTELNVSELKKYFAIHLNSSNIRFAFKKDQQKFNKIAVFGGSGAKNWKLAKRVSADLYLSSEIDHHTCLEAKQYLSLADATHFTTEKFCLNSLEEILLKCNINLPVFISKKSADPFEN